jgi:5'-nucleotidase
MKHILIDMDNVIFATMVGFNKKLSEMFPEVEIIPVEGIRDHNFYNLYPKEVHPKLDAVWKLPGFFRDLEPIPGALEAVLEIARTNHITICSRPFLDSETCESDKKASIRKYLGRDLTKRLGLIRDKTEVRGDILIDDYVNQKTGFYTPTWEHVLYTQPWNLQDTQKRRLTWQNWKQVLPELA